MLPLRRVFLGSASEHLPLVERLQQKNNYARVHYCAWTDVESIRPGEYTLPALLATLARLEGAVFLCLRVDTSLSREKAFAAPRDNVMFEAGLAYGILGHERTLLVTDNDVRLPSDLHGLSVFSVPSDRGAPVDWADTIHAAVEAFFDRVGQDRPPLSYFGPERPPILAPTTLLRAFSDAPRDVERALHAIEQGRYAEAERLLGRSDHLLANYLRCRLAVVGGTRDSLRSATMRLIEQASEAVEDGLHDAYLFFEIATRRLIKTFDETELSIQWLDRMGRSYQPPDLHHLRGLAELSACRYAAALFSL
jgi:CAP12/Pycsar effector protein, TIR domain